MTKVPEHLSGTKVAVRLLPPELEEDHFRQSVESIPKHIINNSSISYFQYVPGVYNPNKPKSNYHPLALMSFTTKEACAAFIEQYNGHCFMNEKKEQFHAVCTFCSNQKPGNYSASKIRNDLQDLESQSQSQSQSSTKSSKTSNRINELRYRLLYLERKYAWNKQRAMESTNSIGLNESNESNDSNSWNGLNSNDKVLNGFFRQYDEKELKKNVIWKYFQNLGDEKALDKLREKLPMRPDTKGEAVLLPADLDPRNTPLLLSLNKKSMKARGEKVRGRIGRSIMPDSPQTDDDINESKKTLNNSSSKTSSNSELRGTRRVRTNCAECGYRKRCDKYDGVFYCKDCIAAYDEANDKSRDRERDKDRDRDRDRDCNRRASSSTKKQKTSDRERDDDNWSKEDWDDWAKRKKEKKERKNKKREERRAEECSEDSRLRKQRNNDDKSQSNPGPVSKQPGSSSDGQSQCAVQQQYNNHDIRMPNMTGTANDIQNPNNFANVPPSQLPNSNIVPIMGHPVDNTGYIHPSQQTYPNQISMNSINSNHNVPGSVPVPSGSNNNLVMHNTNMPIMPNQNNFQQNYGQDPNMVQGGYINPGASCAGCGWKTNLEADPNSPGIYYCNRCWESYYGNIRGGH